MNPSLAALTAMEAPPPGTGRFGSFADMRALALDAGLVPRDGSAVVLPGERLAAFAAINDLAEIESKINGLKVDVMLAAKPELTDALRATVHIAESSTHPHELHYLQAMFVHHRQVMRTLASNKHIPEQTQRLLATDSVLKDDRALQRVLAHNPALTASVMQAMWAETDDSLVQLRITENAAEQATLYDGTNEFAKLCEAFYKGTADRTVRLAAIAGIRDPESLRRIVSTHDVAFGAAELTAVAANRHAPDDVLQALAQPGGVVQRAFSPIASARLQQTARDSIARRNSAAADATLYHSSPD